MTEPFSRDLLRGNLDLVLLSVLADGPKYGYLIQKRIEEQLGSDLKIQAGTMYPLLHRLEAEKLIRARWDDAAGRPRKWYEITAAGRREVQRQALDWRRYVESMGRLLLPVLQTLPEPA